MPDRKPSWWRDTTWTPVSGCKPVSAGCRECWSLPWLKCHTWQTETVYTGAIKEAVDGSVRWTGDLTALRNGQTRCGIFHSPFPVWRTPHSGQENPI